MSNFDISQIKDPSIQEFSNLNPNFDLTGFDFTNDKAIKKLKWDGLDQAAVLEKLKAYQRVLKITPDAETAQALLAEPSKKVKGRALVSKADSLTEQAQPSALDSAHKITAVSREQFVQTVAPKLGENGEEKAAQIYTNATGVQGQAMHLFANVSQLSAPHTMAFAANNVDSDVVDHFKGMPNYEEFFGNQNYCDCAECKSIFGPAAYFVDLMRIAEQFVSQPEANKIDDEMKLRVRRGDLFTRQLTCENTNQTMPYLNIVNERLEAPVKDAFGNPPDLYQTLAQQVYPFELPFQLPLEQIRIYLKYLNVNLADITQALNSSDETVAMQTLNASPEEWQILTTAATGAATFGYFGVTALNQLTDAGDFSRQAELKITEIQDLLFQNLSDAEKTAALSKQFFINKGLSDFLKITTATNSVTINLTNPALDQINRFLRLADKLGWSYAELDWALHCVKGGAPNIDTNALIGIAKICRLRETLDTTVEAACALLFDIKTYGVGEDDTPSDAPFDRIFNGAGLDTYHPKDDGASSYSLNPTYTEDPKPWQIGRSDNTNQKLAARVASGLGLSQNDLITLTGFVFDGQKTLLLTVGNLSLLYRHTQLASIVKLPIEQYVMLLDKLGVSKTVLDADAITGVVQKSDRLKRAGLTVYDLDYIVSNNPSTFVSIPYSDQSLDDWLGTLPGLLGTTAEKAAKEVDKALQAKLVELLAGFLSAQARQITLVLTLLQQNYIPPIFLDPNKKGDAKIIVGKITRWLTLIQKLRLTNDEIISIENSPAAYGIADANNPTTANVLDIARFKDLQSFYSDSAGNLAAYMSAQEADAAAKLADLTGQNALQIAQLLAMFSDANRITRFDKIKPVLDLITKTGTNVDFLKNLKTLVDKDSNKTAKDNWSDYTAAADNLLGAVRARLANSAWDTVYQKIEGEIEELKRTALIGTAINSLGKNPATNWIKNSRNLYEYLLIDVEMSGCAQISYIKEGLNALQLYLQRCRQRLEPKVVSFAVPTDWWQWLSNYRIWEANRKVFLYPENYIDPSLRATKTKLFKDLENSLKQGDISEATVEAAFRKYLDGFSELAKLKYVDAHYNHVSDSRRNDSPVLFLVARTEIQPYKYYYITWESAEAQPGAQNADPNSKGIWSEWQTIDVTIPAEQVSLVYVFNRLFIFWVEQKAHNEKTSNDGSNEVKKAAIKYSFINFSGVWVPPQTLADDIVINVEGSTLLSPANQQNILSILPANAFNINQFWWQKAYPLKIEQSRYWVPGQGVNKFDKVVVFFGPMIDLDANLAGSAVPQASNSKSVTDFDAQLLKMTHNFTQTKNYGYKGFFPILPPIVINNDLTIGYLTSPNEILILQKESAASEPQVRPEIDRSAGQLNLLPTSEVIHDNYICDQMTAPTASNSQTTISTAMRNSDYDFFTVKNHSRSFVFKGDKEAFLLLPIQQEEFAISRELFNADTLFKNDAFISAGAGIQADGSANLYNQLVTSGTFDQFGRLDPSTEPKALRDQLNGIFAGQQDVADKVDCVYNILMHSPIFNSNDFISDAAGIQPSGSQLVFTTLTNEGYLDVNGRLDADVDFLELMQNLKAAIGQQPGADKMVRFVVDTLYQRSFPCSIGFFDVPPQQTTTNGAKFDAVRLTTAAVHKLSTSLFTGGVDAMLSLTSQQIPVEMELPFDRFKFAATVNSPDAIDGTQVDFAGAYGQYYWELFFHAPFYIANMLKSNQQFDQAEKWYKYIFNPTLPDDLLDEESFMTSTLSLRDSKRIYTILSDEQNKIIVNGAVSDTFDSTTDLTTMLTPLDLSSYQVTSVRNVLLNHKLSKSAAHFWQFQPFRNSNMELLKDQLQNANEIQAYNENPFDPHAIARLRIGAYEKAIVMQYVDNLLQWGDSQFAQYTWESLVLATMLYVYAYDLLGERPADLGACPTPTAATFDDIYNKYKNDIPQFFIELEHQQSPSSLPIAFTPINALDTYFGVPENSDFIGYWDKVEDRLFKIRHCLNLQGVHQTLALFEPPIDPMQLVRAASGGGDVLSLLQKSAPGAPYYRFDYLLEKARNFAGVLAQFGGSLLSALEKKDAEALANLKATQEKVILNLMTITKENEIAQTQAMIDSLQKSKDNAQNQHDTYSKWVNDGWSELEKADIGFRITAMVGQASGTLIHALAIAGYLTPSIYGLADGGMQFGDAVNMSSAIADGITAELNQGAGLIATKAQYERRSDDWAFQRDTAQYSIDEIAKQISSNQIQKQILQRELEIHQKSIEQSDDYQSFQKRKFSNEDLYQWMIGQLASLYFQTYRMTLDMAFAAQAVYQSELNSTDTFLQFDYWDSLHRGLLAGESLTLTLNQMDKAYLENNSRTFEIEKTVSLLHLDPVAFFGFRTGIGVNAKGVAAQKGKLYFELSESLFDFDFPGHYWRRIKSLSITIPAVIGPYQNINATLTQEGSMIIQKPDIEAVKNLLGITPNTPSDGSLTPNWMASQQIALSRGVDDSGLFVLDFNDQRYLPFEGTGAVSQWTLSLPPETNQFDFNSISDIIVKVRYTALDGNATVATFADDVRKLLRADQPPYPYMPTKIIDVKQSFASEWQQFMNTAPKTGVQQISFPLTDSMILPNSKDLSFKSVAVVFRTPDGKLVSDKDATTHFLSINIGGSAKTISVSNNYGTVNLDAVPTADGDDCSLIFTLDNVPGGSGLINDSGLSDGKALNPDFLQGIIVIVTYQSNVFSKPK